MKFIPIILFVLLYPLEVRSQEISDTSRMEIKKVAFPVLFYLPETSWGGGITAVANFRFKGEPQTSRPSQIQLGLVYTLNKQWLFFMPFQLYCKNDLYKISGELGYYKFFYNFYGIGTDSESDNLEKYGVNYPRVRVNATRQLNKNLWYGLKYSFDKFSGLTLDSVGQLQNLDLVGVQGGLFSAFSVGAEWDTRDQIFYPSKGLRAEFEYRLSDKSFGSDFGFKKVVFESSYFKSMRQNHILGFNVQTSATLGNAPFYYLNFFGNARTGRGYPDRRFLDRHIFSTQIEYRFPLVWRFSGVSFFTISTVGNDYSTLLKEKFFPSIGSGFRFLLDKKDRLNLRCDLAFTPDDFNFYLTIGEAF